MICGLAAGTAPLSAWARPQVVGNSTTSISYSGGTASASATLNYTGQAMSDALPLVPGGNARSFNSLNLFGRRPFVFNTGPQYANVLDSQTESLVAHAFFKIDPAADYFPGITNGGNLTIRVENITFSEPVTVLRNTVLFHTLWADAQVEELAPEDRYMHMHNIHTLLDPFRDASAFFSTGVISDFPMSNYQFGVGEISVAFQGEGTNELDLELTVPYALLRNLEHMDQVVPAGLPAPQGFLEPFHFHLEYVVTPEPATLVLLGCASAGLLFRRRRSAEG